MNSDEISSLVTKIVLSLCSGLAAKYGVDGNVVATLASGAGALAALAFGVYQHWNLKKVPETATVILTPSAPPTTLAQALTALPTKIPGT